MEWLCFHPGREYLPLIFLFWFGGNGSRRDLALSFCSLFVLLINSFPRVLAPVVMRGTSCTSIKPSPCPVPSLLLCSMFSTCVVQLTCSKGPWKWRGCAQLALLFLLLLLLLSLLCKGYVCLKACAGRKEGRLAVFSVEVERFPFWVKSERLLVLKFWMCSNLRIAVVVPRCMSHVLKCNSVQLLMDSMNVIYIILFNPSGERLGCIMSHIYLAHNYKYASSWLAHLLCWFHPDIC